MAVLSFLQSQYNTVSWVLNQFNKIVPEIIPQKWYRVIVGVRIVRL